MWDSVCIHFTHLSLINLIFASKGTPFFQHCLSMGVLQLDVRDHSYTSETFNGFVDGLLDNMNPFPDRNSVLVMDNASIHKSVALEEMVTNR
jgi:hypothetical protein